MTFSNPILSGNTLIRDAIQSEGFVHGVTGWSIDRDGSAEFDNAELRGSLIVTDGTRTITIDTLGTLAQILLSTNAFGNVGRISVNSGVSPPQLTIESINGASTVTNRITMDGGAFIELHSIHSTDANDAAFYLEESANARISQFIVYAPTTSGSNIPETWHAVSFQNGWTDVGAPFSSCAYRFMPDGTVLLRGVALWDGVALHKANGTTIFNLPAGYRPPSEQAFTTITDVAGNTAAIQITTGGNVQCYRVGTGNVVGFDNSRFPLAKI